MGKWCEYGTYHLDGPVCLKNHLDILLDIEEIDNIEYTPGYGNPPTSHSQFIPAYKKIQRRGKRLYLLAEITEIEILLEELSPKNLFIHTYASSEEEAKDLIKMIEKLSARKLKKEK